MQSYMTDKHLKSSVSRLILWFGAIKMLRISADVMGSILSGDGICQMLSVQKVVEFPLKYCNWHMIKLMLNYCSRYTKCEVVLKQIELNISKKSVWETDNICNCNGTSCIFLIYGTRRSDIQHFVTLGAHNKRPIVQ